jgi:hypothetical protein
LHCRQQLPFVARMADSPLKSVRFSNTAESTDRPVVLSPEITGVHVVKLTLRDKESAQEAVSESSSSEAGSRKRCGFANSTRSPAKSSAVLACGQSAGRVVSDSSPRTNESQALNAFGAPLHGSSAGVVLLYTAKRLRSSTRSLLLLQSHCYRATKRGRHPMDSDPLHNSLTAPQLAVR